MEAYPELSRWRSDADESSILDAIDSPSDLRRLPVADLANVASAMRREILATVSRTGGHLSASLGAVELAIAAHYVFDTPADRLIWDVGHQAYPHKFLTGRRKQFDRIGKQGGIAKFLRRTESPYDVFGAGHAGTSVSAAVGIAESIRRRGGDERVVAVIGDGALAAGMAYEGLNTAGDLGLSNLIVVVNDNGMSISPNVGAMTRFLRGECPRPMRRRLRSALANTIAPGGEHHESVVDQVRGASQAMQQGFAASAPFEALGFHYVGPVDGHDLEALVEAFSFGRSLHERGEPILVHCKTRKGQGYAPAEREPQRYHGVGQFEVESGRFAKKAGARAGATQSWTQVFSDALTRLAGEDERIVAITAAMAEGTGLERFQRSHPERFYDVGIAEQHAVTMAAGMATEGAKPVCAIYSTFLQRAFDQVAHDVCVQDLDVTFAIDRAGLVGADGATHQGLYDFAYLRTLPNLVLMAPRDANELRRMLRTAIEHPGPAAVRYPRGNAPSSADDEHDDEDDSPIEIGRSQLLREGRDVALVAIGSMVGVACEAAERLEAEGLSAAVLDARFVDPLDERAILGLASQTRAVLTMEEHVGKGGFGEAVASLLAGRGAEARFEALALPDRVLHHGDPAELLSECGLDVEGAVAAALRLSRRNPAQP